MRYIFMGTPQYAQIILGGLINAGHPPVGIMTQCDQPAGRGKVITPPPVKNSCEMYGIPNRQPRKIGEPTREWIKSLEADICLVAAYGKIFTEETLATVPHGFINAHASLLPKYRGAAPLAWAIINGEKETGISIMQIDGGMDTGDVLLQQSIPIDNSDTCQTLAFKLAQIGAPMFLQVMDEIEKGTVNRIPQSSFDAEPSYAFPLKKQDGLIDWDQDAFMILRRIRGTNPWPGSFTYIDSKLLKIIQAEPVDLECEPDSLPGTITKVEKTGLVVVTGKGALRLMEVQLEGKKSMPSYQFAMGQRLEPGKCLLNG